jgi:dolichol-phosphate mannosyltransferase
VIHIYHGMEGCLIKNKIINYQILPMKPSRTDRSKNKIIQRNAAFHELVLVMPVYNEEQCVAAVIQSWYEALMRLSIDFRMIVLNDGSQDGTETILKMFANNHRIDVFNRKNSGHGPTILEGYHKAVKYAEWVFQTDSDDEMKPDHFIELWKRRDQYEALFGVRQNRHQTLIRKGISILSRLMVFLLFGKGVKDVNVPYRLIKASLMKQIIEQIPADMFVPNIIISGALAKSHLPIYNHLIPCEGRKTGAPSLNNMMKLLKATLKSFWQTICCWPKIKV